MNKKARSYATIMFVVTGAFLAFGGIARATNFSSTNFTVKDPVIAGGAGYATSTSFRLWSSVSQLGIGTSSATTFGLRAGFLYFPAEAAPTPTPTPTPSPSEGGPLIQRTGGILFGSQYLIPFQPVPPAVRPPRPGEPLLVRLPCNRRSDLNCDGKIDLQDFSIFLSEPAQVTPRTLSFLLFDWTAGVPRFVSEESLLAYAPSVREEERPPEKPVGLAEVGEAFRPTGEATTTPSFPTIRTETAFGFLARAVKAIARFIIAVSQYIKSVIFGL